MQRKVFCGIFAFISSLSFAILSRTNIDIAGEIHYLNTLLSDIDISDTLIFIALLIGYLHYPFLCRKVEIFIGGLFSVFTIVGKSYWELGNWNFIFGSMIQCIVAILTVVGVWIFFSWALGIICKWLENTDDLIKCRADNKYFDKHCGLIFFCILCVCWLPYILINLPGSVPYDGYRQLNMALGIQNATNHHPYLISLLFGGIFSVGRRISDNTGILLIVIFNCMISAGVYAYIIKRIKMWGFVKPVYIAVLLFFALVPAWGSFIQAVIKDTLYFPLFALYVLKYIDLYEAIKLKKQNKVALSAQYILVAILLMFARNNGFYIVVPATIALFFVELKNNKTMIVCILSMLLIINWGYHNVFLPMNNVSPGGIQEMLSVPFQQTARFVKYYSEELSEEEKDTIDKVLDYESLAEKYNPDKSDPVKDTIRKNVTKENLIDFFRVWLKMLISHPGVCIQATINNTYGYFYPAYICRVLLSYNYYIETKKAAATGDLNIHYYVPDSKLRAGLNVYSNFWQLAPGLSMLESPGFYTWLLIILVGLIIRKHFFKELVVMIIPLLHIAICLVSPVNGLLRYAMPLMAAMPLLFCWTMRLIHLKRVNENG